MTDKKTEAQRLADALESMNLYNIRFAQVDEAAAELRRLDAEVQQWQEKCQTYIELHDAVVKDSDRLYALNAELVEALEKLARLGNEPMYGNSIGNKIAQAALRKAQGDNND